MEVRFRNPLALFMRKVGFRFDLAAWVFLSQSTDTDYGDWADMPENQFTTALMYGAYCSFCIEHKKRRVYDIHDIYKLKRYWEKHSPEKIILLKKSGIESAYLGEKMSEKIKDAPKGEKKN